MFLLVAGLARLYHCLMLAKKPTVVQWQPHEVDSPYEVLRSAQADAAAGRYELALAKHDWFHRKMRKLEARPYGERLSSALAAWVKLGKAYPPALAHLTAIRDGLDKAIRGRAGGTDHFIDFEAINRHVGEEKRTAQTFLWIDRHRPMIAPRVFEFALPALIKTRQFTICSKHLDVRTAMRKAFRKWRALQQTPWKAHADAAFARDVATAVALFVINGRTREANELTRMALKQRNTPSINRTLESALAGKLPEAANA
ncbi:MAG: hypothetical protein L0Y58_20775 [Verrucomicrobia subdivision 3 bacterium]|nr:hypothetical protein [Limisphaerales bacterium]